MGFNSQKTKRIAIMTCLVFLFFILVKINVIKADWEQPSAEKGSAIVPVPLFNFTTLNDKVYSLLDRIVTVTGDFETLGDLSGATSIDVGGDVDATGNFYITGDFDTNNLSSLGNLSVNGRISASEICNNSKSVCRNLSVPWAETGSVETDPTVPAFIKDGITWNEVTGIPAGFADGLDNTAFSVNYYGVSQSTDSVKLGASTFNVNLGNHNTAIGVDTLASNSSGINNVAIGRYSLHSNTNGHDNTAAGFNTLLLNQSGNYNVAFGSQALPSNQGNNNTAVGYRALAGNYLGGDNTAIGHEAMSSVLSGGRNTAVGSRALRNVSNGIGNVAIGYEACMNCTGSYNVAIGYQAGRDWTGNNRLFINNDSGTPLIGGDFSTRQVFINGVLAHTSDIRLKNDIEKISGAFSKISRLQGVEFAWKKTGIKDIGLIAQEVEKVYPELVVADESTTEKFKSINYSGLIAPLIEVVKEQNEQINKKQELIDFLKKELDNLER